MRRRPLLIGLLSVVLVAFVVLLRPQDRKAAPALDPMRAAASAATACADFVRLKDAVEAGGSADAVFAFSGAMRDGARNAQIEDPKWVQLYSAALELDFALHHNDGPKTAQALPILSAQCSRLGTP